MSPPAKWLTGTCAECGREFRYPFKPKKPVHPETCGYPHCRARHDWGPADWAGRERMARSRLAAGRPIDGLDIEALLTERETR